MLAIRDEQVGDAAAVRALHCGAFAGTARPSRRCAECVRLYCDFAVGVEEGAVVGHVLFSRLDSPARALPAPLAVSRSFRRRGIGATLVRAGLARATDQGWASCSFSAIRPIMAALASPAEEYECPYANLCFMARVLKLPVSERGRLVSPAAFAAVGWCLARSR